ncbi:hypothetical protein BGZ63DRAFT_443314 [Mariannaea sp. PMI_226]|nr:hypothetical protein BGZ63DRAFT_443314 [Mariannaea sp. PMI_226]
MGSAFHPIPPSSQAEAASSSNSIHLDLDLPPTISPSRPRSFDLATLAMELPQNDVQGRAIRATLCDRTLQSIQQVALQNQAASRAEAPRSLTSPNWRAPQSFGDVGNWPPTAQGNYTLSNPTNRLATNRASTTGFRSELPAQQTPSLEGYAYCIDRGNGQYTRLVPADVLPPMVEISARQSNPNGMVVLPELQKAPPQGVAEMNRPITIKRQIDRIVATVPATPKRAKVYCDKWVHEGTCAFAQQGCKYKHEIPFDKATQHSLGLYQGLPAWYKKHQAAELQRHKDREDPGSTARRVFPLVTDRPGVGKQGQTGWRKANVIAMQQNQMPGPASPSSMDFGQGNEVFRPLSISTTSPLSRNIWGPIEPPQKPGSGSSSPTVSETTTWASRYTGSFKID